MVSTLVFQGSRGDVEPGIALAEELARRGRPIRFAVPPNVVDDVRRRLSVAPAVEVSACGPDTSRTLASTVATREIKSRNPVRRLRAATALATEDGIRTRRDLLAVADGSDVVIGSNVGQEAALDVAERLGVPYVPVHLCPVRPTRAVSFPPLPSRVPGPVRLAGWHALDRALWHAARATEAAHRHDLGLPAASSSVARRLRRLGTTEIQAYDRALFPTLPDEWGARRPLVGFLRPTGAPAGLDPDLAAWLSAGPAPVYVGFGSMTVPDGPAVIRAILDELGRRGHRALVAGGWSRLGADDDRGGDDARRDVDDRVRWVDQVDHRAVLPRCTAVVHHGGAGTVAAGLRAGCPTLVCSIGADQPLWGARVTALGTGASMPARAAHGAALGHALDRVLHPDTRVRAAAVARELVPPDVAVRAAADALESATDRRVPCLD
ncbi:glycosyltransferase [Rhodococcoides corynebacterioides]|uniref:glycosyltransferase n=1 Tax=Rhodococcoides corynebacterioides TaxID=53972 RepID=UPI0021C01A9F|nr:glycosyltransferase [Rhodococcus corynebacterioides]